MTEERNAVNPLLPPPPPQTPPAQAPESSPILGDAVSAHYGPPTPLYVSNPQGPQLPTWRVNTPHRANPLISG